MADHADPAHAGGGARYTILSMMKDEGPALLEWLAYHRHIGFDNICVYTNDCSDGTDRMLMRLEEMGECRHFRNEVPPGRKPQPHALDLAQDNPAVTASEWILVMDADEFVSIKTGRGWVRHLVEAVPDDTDAIVLTWRFFGSNGHVDWQPGPVVESYTSAAPDRFRKGWGVKTMFRPFAHMKFGIHRPTAFGLRQHPDRAEALARMRWVNGSGQPMPEAFALSGWRSTGPSLGYGLAEMNHYAVKSIEAYLLRRLRGNVNNKPDKYNSGYFAIFDRNEVEAPNARRHMRGTRKRIAGWLEDPILARLHEEALAFHRDRVARLRQSADYAALVEDLRRAGETPIEKLDEVLYYQHLPPEWREKIDRLRAAGVPKRELALAIARSTGLHEARATSGKAPALGDAAGTEEPATHAPEAADPGGHAPEAGAGPDAAAARAPGSKAEKDRPLPPAPRVLRQGEAPRIHLVSTLKNEGPYLVEWIAYHRAIGVTDFTLFSNDCTDGTNLMLDRLEAMGVVRHFDNPLAPGMDPQRRAYSRANKMEAVRAADWVLVIDADEFVNVRTGGRTLPELIAACDGADAISLGWRFMGSAGHARWEDAPVTARFRRGCSLVAPENGLVRGFKTLFRPAAFDYFGVHRPRFEKSRAVLPRVRWVDGSGRPMGERVLTNGWRFPEEEAGYDLGWVNHYAVKSREEFLLKRLRGTANSKDAGRIDFGYWDKLDLNALPDDALPRGALPMEALAGEIDRLMADYDLAALRRACLASARKVLDAQLEDPALAAFVETGARAAAE